MGTESTTISAKCGSSLAFEGDLDCSAAVSVGFVSALDGDGVDAVGYGDSGLCSSEWLLGGVIVVQRMLSVDFAIGPSHPPPIGIALGGVVGR